MMMVQISYANLVSINVTAALLALTASLVVIQIIEHRLDCHVLVLIDFMMLAIRVQSV